MHMAPWHVLMVLFGMHADDACQADALTPEERRDLWELAQVEEPRSNFTRLGIVVGCEDVGMRCQIYPICSICSWATAAFPHAYAMH